MKSAPNDNKDDSHGSKTKLLQRVCDDSDVTTPSSLIKSHIILCSIFTVVYTAYLAIQNLESSLNKADNVGLVSLIIIYTACVFFSFVSPAIVSFLGGKLTLAIGWIGHCLFTAANFYPAFSTLVPASFILGVVSVPVWTTQGVYVSHYAINYAKLTGQDVASMLSKFNGIFFMFFQTPQISGNLITSLVLYKDDFNETLSNSTSFPQCGSADCPGSSANETSSVPLNTIYLLMGVFAALDVIGLIMTVFLMKNVKLEDKKVQIWQSTLSVLRHLLDPDILLLSPLFLLNGYEQAIVFADFTKVSLYVLCHSNMNLGKLSAYNLVFSSLIMSARYVSLCLPRLTYI